MTAGEEKHAKGWRLDIALDFLLAALLAVALTGLLAFRFPLGGQVQLRSGMVAPTTINAPRRISYESAILTQRARERAAQGVSGYYDPPLNRIRLQQVRRAQEILEFISSVRDQTDASLESRVNSLLAIQDLNLTPGTARQLLELTPESWRQVQQEVPSVLDQVMRDDIKETTLPAARRRIHVLISAELDENAVALVNELVRPLVHPNSFYNPERTEALRRQAQNAVPVQTRTLEAGETILRAGDIVTEEDVEALHYVGLDQNTLDTWSLFQAVLISMTLLALIAGTIYRLCPDVFARRREFGLLALLMLTGLVAARLMIVPHDWIPYLFPLAAFSMLAAVLLDLRAATVIVLSFSLIIVYLSRGDVHLVFYTSVGGLLSALVLGRAERLTSFLWAAVTIMLANLVVSVAFWSLPLNATTTAQVVQVVTVAVLNGGISASMALIGYFVLGNLFGITTTLQLVELSRPTHPLLRQLLLKAPGTYHHTILVSNLAERAAEAIGADAFLTRVGAYYHDIGKIVRPYFFAENITDEESSPHRDLDPQTSAQIIISHVKDGADLARKYKLPSAIQDFIWQHHGTQLMAYFYGQALKAGGDEAVNEADFRYPGPDPQSKEAAITMLADVCEAAIRAERPATRGELEEFVETLITQRVLDGSLDRSDLTFSELQTVKRTFVHVLQGVHHPRVRYPKMAPPEPQATPSDATTGDTYRHGDSIRSMGEAGGRYALNENGRAPDAARHVVGSNGGWESDA